jgi:hypothetical protein
MEDQKKLIIGNEYTVRKTQLNSSSSYVWLEEFPSENDDDEGSPFFSLSSFEWCPPPFEPSDLIGLHGATVLRIRDTYPVGIFMNGQLVASGDPIIAIRCDMPQPLHQIEDIRVIGNIYDGLNEDEK